MLIKSGWNQEAALNGFLSDTNYIRKTFKFTVEEAEARVEEYRKSSLFTCPCCYDDVKIKDGIIIEECGHYLCKDCFKDYIKEKFKNGPDCVHASCPDHSCGMIIPSHLFQKSLSKVDFKKYEYYVLKSFVDLSPKTKWCPGKNCEKACVSKSDHQINIECDCGTEFCFNCTESAHKPMDCKSFQNWLERI